MEMGGRGRWEGGDYIIYLSLHCHRQSNSCIKMGSDDSPFNVSLIVRDEVTRQCPQSTTFEEKGEPKQLDPSVLLSCCLRPRRRDGLLGTGTEWEGDDRVKARPRKPSEKDRRDRGPPLAQWKC